MLFLILFFKQSDPVLFARTKATFYLNMWRHKHGVSFKIDKIDMDVSNARHKPCCFNFMSVEYMYVILSAKTSPIR